MPDVVRDGQYQIDPVLVADAILRHCAREWPVMASLMADAVAEAVAAGGSGPPDPPPHSDAQVIPLVPRRLSALGKRPPQDGGLAAAGIGG